ncbi:MAG TPA: flavin reductase family protein [Pirellulales bacterium]
MSASHLASVLGRLPSGLFIVTARRDGDETGMLASWIMQAGFEPPMITVALHKDRLLARWLATGTPFTVNLLADDQQRLVAHFGRGFEEAEPAFDGLKVSRSPSGAVVLDGTIGYLECEPTGHIDSADHRIFLARVVLGYLSDGERPMVHIRKNGMKY